MKTLNQYPRQFWLLLGGFFVNRASSSLIWPFLAVILHERLNAPLATITLLISLQSIAGFVSASAVGTLMDKFGRKQAMVASLIAAGGVLLGMSSADTLGQWALLILLYGALTPVFMVGANAMTADLVQPERRLEAYGLMRMVANLGIAIGPAIGGLLIAVSPTLTYHIAAAAELILALIVGLLMTESLSQDKQRHQQKVVRSYWALFQDREFIAFCGRYILVELAALMVFVLLPVYTKTHFAIAESQYGLLLTVNAGMIVLFQFAVMRIISRYNTLSLMAVGALFYALGHVGFAVSGSFGGFAVSMAVLTVGELIEVPVATALVASLSPADMRARYMGVFSLAENIAAGVGPVFGGLLSDHIAPSATWYGGAAIAGIAALSFLLMARARSAGTVQGTVAITPSLQEG